jgi:hypothetical protein
MRVLRDWISWAAAWVLVVQSPVWVAVALDAWEERTDPTLEPMPVATWVPGLAYVAGAAVPLGLLLVVVGLRLPAARRAGFATGALGLAVGAVAFTGFPDSVVGEWYVGLTALAAACAVVAAVAPNVEREAPPGSGAAMLPGVLLVASGAFLAFTCWRGGSYWDWRGEAALGYALGLGASVVLGVLGATATRWARLSGRVLRWVLVVVGVLASVYVFAGTSALFADAGVLYRWEEDESPWDYGISFLLVGTGLVASAVAAWRRRGDLAAWSLASATSFALLSLWQQSTWGSVMR